MFLSVFSMYKGHTWQHFVAVVMMISSLPEGPYFKFPAKGKSFSWWCGCAIQIQECSYWCQSWYTVKCMFFCNAFCYYDYETKLLIVFSWQMAATLTLTDIVPSLKSIASVNLPEYDSAKVHPFNDEILIIFTCLFFEGCL